MDLLLIVKILDISQKIIYIYIHICLDLIPEDLSGVADNAICLMSQKKYPL